KSNIFPERTKPHGLGWSNDCSVPSLWRGAAQIHLAHERGAAPQRQALWPTFRLYRTAKRNMFNLVLGVWCRRFHRRALWPLHCKYICPRCLREYPVQWGTLVGGPLGGGSTAGVAGSRLGRLEEVLDSRHQVGVAERLLQEMRVSRGDAIKLAHLRTGIAREQ